MVRIFESLTVPKVNKQYIFLYHWITKAVIFSVAARVKTSTDLSCSNCIPAPGFRIMTSNHLGPVVRSLVSANRWLRAIKTYRFPWYLTLVSTNHASSNPGLETMELFITSYVFSSFIGCGQVALPIRQWHCSYSPINTHFDWNRVINAKMTACYGDCVVTEVGKLN